MATILESINSGLCTLGSIIGMESSKTCITQIKKARSLWWIKPGEEFRARETFADEFERLIINGYLVICNGIDSFEENGNEDTIDTSDGGVEQVTQEGLYKYLATFVNGMFFNKAMHTTVKGFKRWNGIIVTQDGIFGTKTTTGGLTGFTTGMVQPAKVITGTSSTSQKEGLAFQFLDRDEFDTDYAFIADTTARKQKGVTQIEVSYVNNPADTDTTLTIKAVHAQNVSEAFTGQGVDFSDFLGTKAGVTSNPTAGDDSATAGTYVLTVPARVSGEADTIRLYDNTNNVNVIKGSDGDYYRSNIATATVT